MKVYFQGRRSGKTTIMIKESNRTGYPIVCQSESAAHFIELQARQMKTRIPKPVSIRSVVERRRDGYRVDAVLIDEAQAVLDAIICDSMHCHIGAMTVNDDGAITRRRESVKSYFKRIVRRWRP